MLSEIDLDDAVNKLAISRLPTKLGNYYDYVHLLSYISSTSNGRLNADMAKICNLWHTLDNEKRCSLQQKLDRAWNDKSYKSIRDIDYLQGEVYRGHVLNPYSRDEKRATEQAWNAPFSGMAAHSALECIQEFCYSDNPDELCEKFILVTQSPGMGKSRLVDEISKFQFTIPMVIRKSNDPVYPPGDENVYDYLTLPCNDPGKSELRAAAFLHSLFTETKAVLVNERSPPVGLDPIDRETPLAEQFRAYMNQGMTNFAHGAFRQGFYSRVTWSAYRFLSTYTNAAIATSAASTAFNELLQVVKSFHTVRSPTGQTCDHSDRNIEVLLSFDEIDSLSSKEANFHGLTEVLKLQSCIVSLLLSGGNEPLAYIPPEHRCWFVTIPHSVVGELAMGMYPPTVDGLTRERDKALTIACITQEDHFCFCGRPLWPSRYLNGNAKIKETIIPFAAKKLLGDMDYDYRSLLLPQSLACLTQRLPLEFMPSPYYSERPDSQSLQVRSHMRVIGNIGEKDDRNFCKTLSPAEPILSEAAYWMMSAPGGNFRAAETLHKVVRGHSVSKETRGELLVLLLLVLARDKEVGLPDDVGCPSSGRRWCTLNGFISELFTDPLVILGQVRSPSPEGNHALKPSFHEIFADSRLYFNRFLEVYQFGGVEHLMALMALGAAPSFPDHYKCIDGVIPFVFKGDEIRADNIGVIMYWATDDKTIGKTLDHQQYHFDIMDRDISDLISELSPNVPTIRFIFSLATKTPGLNAVPPSRSQRSRKTYNFWVNGISPDVLKPIGYEGQDAWKALFDALTPLRAMFEGDDPETKARRMRFPGGGVHPDHWTWCATPPRSSASG